MFSSICFGDPMIAENCSDLGMFHLWNFSLYRVKKEWKELQAEVGELFKARP